MTTRNFIVHEPVGVVSLIVPWNFPLLMAVLGKSHLHSQQVYGVVKPAKAYNDIHRLFEIFESVSLPDGVANDYGRWRELWR